MWLKPSAHIQHALYVPYKALLVIAHRIPACLDGDEQPCMGEAALRGP
jgi:hypothetical protein